MNLLKMIIGMGPAACVIFGVLVAMSLASVAVGTERWLVHRRAHRDSRRFVLAAGRLVRGGDLEGTLDLARRFRASHVSQVVAAGIVQYRTDLEGSRIASVRHAVTRAERAIERETSRVHATLERGLGALATIGSTAPFVGLLGTVVGVINAFHQIGVKGGSDLATVSGGISEALIETAVGLVVAIPAVWLYNYFSRGMRRLEDEMRNAASELLDELLLRRDFGPEPENDEAELAAAA